MNKDLMMKAAVQFKGVWPTAMAAFLITPTRKNDVFGNGRINFVSDEFNLGDYCEIICTREQFDVFVESLFESAPEGTTHYGLDGLFYCLDETEMYYSYVSRSWVAVPSGAELTENLIPRPAKKAPTIGDTPEQLKKGVQPEAPYMPKVGEKCEYKYKNYKDAFSVGVVKFIGDKIIVINNNSGYEKCYHIEYLDFRPIRTKAEKLVEEYNELNTEKYFDITAYTQWLIDNDKLQS
jgi:hypothetical protein